MGTFDSDGEFNEFTRSLIGGSSRASIGVAIG
jgi:hypothetical protein